MQNKIWDFKTHKIVLKPVPFDAQSNARWIILSVDAEKGKDEFQFSVSVFEAMKYPNREDDEYIEMAVENINHYIEKYGIRGNQTHLFDFIDSNFIPRERIDWP